MALVQDKKIPHSGLQITVHTEKLFFLFFNQNIRCEHPKEPSQWDGSFEHPKHMFKWMSKEINAFLVHKRSLSGPMHTDGQAYG